MAKGKDPAALFFIDTWLTATAEMKADCRGWYLNLILHQFDKGSLPNDIEELASLAQVRFSEFDLFKQVYEQVLKHKFQLNSNGRLENAVATQILRAREDFKEKRSGAGKISAFIKFIRKHLCQDENVIFFVKQHVDLSKIDTKNQQVLKQVFEHLHQLYINGNGNNTTTTVGEDGEEEKHKWVDSILQQLEGVEDASIDAANSQLYLMIVLRMIEAFKQKNPDYFFQKESDYSACLRIAYHIAQMKGWTKDSVLNDNLEACVGSWKTIIDFVHDDKWFSTRSLTDLSTTKEWQRLVQSMNSKKTQKNGTHQQSSSPKSATAIKADAANALLGIAQDRIAALAAGATGA